MTNETTETENIGSETCVIHIFKLKLRVAFAVGLGIFSKDIILRACACMRYCHMSLLYKKKFCLVGIFVEAVLRSKNAFHFEVLRCIVDSVFDQRFFLSSIRQG